MVNSVPRLQEMKAFMRMSGGHNLQQVGWNGDGTGTADALLAGMPGVLRDQSGQLRFADWNCRAGENNVIVRTDGTVGPCFPMYAATYDWGNIEGHKFDRTQLKEMKTSCQQHCFSTLNHNMGYCYNDARVIKWLWQQTRNGMSGGAARSFED
jgi:radical SAM protein with 4Fe4S-binding SPASM domain